MNILHDTLALYSGYFIPFRYSMFNTVLTISSEPRLITSANRVQFRCTQAEVVVMKAVNIKEARQKFAQLIESARRGTPIAITRRGKKVAQITGTRELRGKLPDLAAFRAGLKGGRGKRETTIKDLRNNERA
jgi:prevent-host-death family protein